MPFHLSRCVRAIAVLAAALAAGALHAQTDAQRIEITGSSIKRIGAEGALPVITLRRADIERSGAGSVTELLQALPAMQGFTAASDSVNGGAGGTTTASLRNLGPIYTLVLLNGRRLAPYDSGSTVNLEQLPLSAIERVEILADGASALYGADAIAGVVNFITRRHTERGAIELSASDPQHGGGRERSFGLSKGLGDLERDGYNLLAALSVSRSDKIAASQRRFSRSGVIPFSHQGRDLYFWQLSINASPPNVELLDAQGETLDRYSPYKVTRGTCGSDPAAFAQGDTCRFDFPATVEAQPESERKSLFVSGQLKLGAATRLFGEALLTDVSMTSRFAPPAQALRLRPTDTLYQRHVLPTLAARGIDPADVADATLNMRLRDAGLRANRYGTRGTHVVAGVEGTLAGFDGTLSFTHSRNELRNDYAGGYASRTALRRLIDAGRFDPFAQGTGEANPALAEAVLDGPISDTTTQRDMLSLRGQRELFALGAGPVSLGLGLDIGRQRYADTPSPMSMGPNALQPGFADFPVGATQGGLPLDTRRDQAGLFGELLLPLAKGVELTAALRHDRYDAARNERHFDADGRPAAGVTQGNRNRRTTYKLGLRLQPAPDWLLRGSYGSGFRAPTLQDITLPLVDFGVTGAAYDCPAPAGDPLTAGCRSLPTQYNVRIGGNALTGSAGLRPETSAQWSLGARFEPGRSWSLGADLWSVKIDDVVTKVPEATAFRNFAAYRSLFSVTTDAATGRRILTLDQVQINGAQAKSSGVDLDIATRLAIPGGRMDARLMATYLVESYVDFGFGEGRQSSLGRLGKDDKVAFRTQLRLQASAETGPFTNTLTAMWRPGYLDKSYEADDGVVRERRADGSPEPFVAIDDFRVGSFWTLDWQGRWALGADLVLQAGVKNLFDRQPPLSIKNVGGNMMGYDPRYADGRGRSFQLGAQLRF